MPMGLYTGEYVLQIYNFGMLIRTSETSSKNPPIYGVHYSAYDLGLAYFTIYRKVSSSLSSST